MNRLICRCSCSRPGAFSNGHVFAAQFHFYGPVRKQQKKILGKKDKRSFEQRAVDDGQHIKGVSLFQNANSRTRPEKALTCPNFSLRSIVEMREPTILRITSALQERLSLIGNPLLTKIVGGLMRKEYTLPRLETLTLFQTFQSDSKRDKRTLIVGQKGIGKSTLLLQLQMLALLMNGIVLPFPNGDILTSNLYPYRYDEKSGEWYQGTLAQNMMRVAQKINENRFKEMRSSRQYEICGRSVTIGSPLTKFVTIAEGNPEHATAALEALLDEILLSNEQILITMDNYDSLAVKSNYRDMENRALSPLSFSIPKRFAELMNGSRQISPRTMIGSARGNIINAKDLDIALGVRPYCPTDPFDASVEELVPASIRANWPLDRRDEMVFANENGKISNQVWEKSAAAPFNVGLWTNAEANVYGQFLSDAHLTRGWSEGLQNVLLGQKIAHSGGNPAELERVCCSLV